MQKLTLTTSYIAALNDQERKGHHNHVIKQRLLNLSTALDSMPDADVAKLDKEYLSYLQSIDDTTIIEQQNVERDYELNGIKAIIHHPIHGYLFIADGFGGIDSLKGGAVRWEHGILAKVNKSDTLDSLGSDYMTFDNILEFNGFAIDAIAKHAGL